MCGICFLQYNLFTSFFLNSFYCGKTATWPGFTRIIFVFNQCLHAHKRLRFFLSLFKLEIIIYIRELITKAFMKSKSVRARMQRNVLLLYAFAKFLCTFCRYCRVEFFELNSTFELVFFSFLGRQLNVRLLPRRTWGFSFFISGYGGDGIWRLSLYAQYLHCVQSLVFIRLFDCEYLAHGVMSTKFCRQSYIHKYVYSCTHISMHAQLFYSCSNPAARSTQYKIYDLPTKGKRIPSAPTVRIAFTRVLL